MLQLQCDELKDDDRPSNTLEHFTELEQVLDMIDAMKSSEKPEFEREFEHFRQILSRYQEQPHLLDPHIEVLLAKLMTKVRDPSSCEADVHAPFKYLYILCKVRTYKVLVKFLPHELSDLEFALNLLEIQNPKDIKNWETRYMLLLWMSILVLNPFHMARLDAHTIEQTAPSELIIPTIKTKMERIFLLCKQYSATTDTCSNIAAYLSAKFLTRSDTREQYLKQYFDWVISQNRMETVDVKFGQLAAVAAILKHGKREDLLLFADKLRQWIISCQYKTSSDFLKYKLHIKIMQRIGLIYLKPRIADWRYKRGTRSLTLNLTKTTEDVNKTNSSLSNENNEEQSSFEEIVVPDAVEEVIEELLLGLRSGCSDVRWSAAKGLGRVTNRLTQQLANDVIDYVIELLNPLEPPEAWHGGCLALAELAKRGLLLPERFEGLVPLLVQALFYDEMKGYMSVGQPIRDSACYICWAFARAYKPEDLQPFIIQIAGGLLTVAVFDREINCRRAASAAFQESVGRLGNFPHGIEISATTNFYSVGMRQNSFLNISDFIAQFDEYRLKLINHLIDNKVNHWDVAVRELTAKALHKLTFRAPVYMAEKVLRKLLLKTDSVDINTRHGSILALGEITLALRKMQPSDEPLPIDANTEDELSALVGKFLVSDLFRGMSGELMKQCCTDFIRNCSLAGVYASGECLDFWQEVIDKCLINKAAPIRESAALAFAELCKTYYNTPFRCPQNCEIVRGYLEGADNDLEEHVRMGYISALGALPRFMIGPHIDAIIDSLVKHSLTPLQAVIAGELPTTDVENIITYKWSEARRDSVKALGQVIKTVGFEEDNDGVTIANPKYFNKIFECFLKAMDEYTLDNRGDIGAWVREAAMTATFDLLVSCPEHLLTANNVRKVFLCLVQQSVEKIDRTRGLAGRLFCTLIHHDDPLIPHIPQHDHLKEVFPIDSGSVLWLFADHTFPLFCALLQLPDYSQRVLLGLSASIGQLTESLIKYSSAAFFQFLRSHPGEVPRLCQEIIGNFEENILNERVTYPMLNFLDILMSSGTVTSVLLDDASQFAEDIYRLVNLEIKGHKKLYKLVSSINVFCQLIQVPRLCKKVLSKMSIFLGLTHVHVRKTTATKLYEALALYSDTCDNIPSENVDEILTLLSETDWGLPLVEVRPLRNTLCNLLDIKPPIPGSGSRPLSRT